MAVTEPAPSIRSIEDLASSTAGVVEEARHGIVHLRAADGDNLVLFAEQQYDELTRWARAVLVTIRALQKSQADRRPDDFGDTPWLAVFDDEDLTTFVAEVGNAILIAIGTGAHTVDDLHTLGRDWETTANVIADPLSREILLGHHNADDFIEVSRPT